ncbi:putative TIR domain-containing protein [Helianthus annuus]|nr:putative TIR domain-containing protein [Helianthus annuus]
MASTSSSFIFVPKYDAFLSFRGEDTGYNFIDHLYVALCRAEIVTFLDSETIQAGQQLLPEILRVITESRASIVVFTENYAKSSWCLEELLLILEQKRKGSHFVLPVYHGVDPSDVWNQRGNFKIEAKTGWTVDKVNHWKAALTEVANLMVSAVTGYRPETSLIIDIVNTIYSQLGLNPHNPPPIFDHLIEDGMEGKHIGKN